MSDLGQELRGVAGRRRQRGRFPYRDGGHTFLSRTHLHWIRRGLTVAWVLLFLMVIDALVTHVKKWSPVANTFTRPVNLEVSA